ncbi:MAG: peptidoglycan DD-metalloendopeptidase family protein [candidate division WOR-3 bacterium]
MKNGFYIKILRKRGDLKGKDFFVPLILFKFLFSFSIFILFYLIFATYIFVKKEKEKKDFRYYAEENRKLKNKLEDIEKKLNKIKDDMIDLIEKQNRLRNYLDFEPISLEILNMPIGGIPKKKEKIEQIEERIDYMMNLVNMQEKEINNLKYFLEKSEDLRKRTPSISPVKSAFVTAKFGYREDPFTGIIKFHKGIDIAGPKGTPIFATADGIVKYAGWKEGLGLTVEIDHGNGFITVYGHNDRILVKPFQRVRRGDVIATMGSTGLATGVHLHYEVKLFEKNLNPIYYIIPEEEYFD